MDNNWGSDVHYIGSRVASGCVASAASPLWDVCSSCSLLTRHSLREKGRDPFVRHMGVHRALGDSSFEKCAHTVNLFA